jgi:hypothetical protein
MRGMSPVIRKKRKQKIGNVITSPDKNECFVLKKCSTYVQRHLYRQKESIAWI